MPSPSIAILILNWNQRDLTLDCLASVMRLDYPTYRVIVVDNGSTDGSVAAIRAAYPALEALALASNRGYAEGNNVGIRYALEHGAEYVLILNNDTLVAPTLVSELLQVAQAQPGIGMVGPTMYCAPATDILFAAGSFLDWARGETWHRGMFRPANQYANFKRPEPVDFITGCAVLVSRALIETVGVLDPLYYLNYEDVEWAVRARRRGFEIWYAPQAVIWHRVSATLGLASPANTYYMTRNSLLFFWRNAPPHLRWLAVSRILARTLRTVGAWSLRSRYQTDAFQRLRDANLLAVRDFFGTRFGKMGPDVAEVCYGRAALS